MNGAQAMQFRAIQLGGDNKVLVLAEGEIVDGDLSRLGIYLQKLRQSSSIIGIDLDSPGGTIVESEGIANLIRQNQLFTVVGEQQRCVSACFLIFAAGSKRFAANDALIGVHSASTADGRETIASMAMTTAVARDAAAFGIPDNILGKLVATGPGGVSWLTHDDLATMNVTLLEDDHGNAQPTPSQQQASNAQPTSRDQLPPPAIAPKIDERALALRAAKNFDREYKRSGMAGLRASVDACYVRSLQLGTVDAVEYCYVLYRIASGIDAAVSKQFGIPQDSFWTEDSVTNRTKSAVLRLSLDPDILAFAQRWEPAYRTALEALVSHH